MSALKSWWLTLLPFLFIFLSHFSTLSQFLHFLSYMPPFPISYSLCMHEAMLLCYQQSDWEMECMKKKHYKLRNSLVSLHLSFSSVFVPFVLIELKGVQKRRLMMEGSKLLCYFWTPDVMDEWFKNYRYR